MKSLAFLACLLGATATTASAWVEQNPAFPRGQAPKAVPLSVITGAGSATAYTFATQDQKTAKLVLAVGEKGGTTLAITDQSGKAVYGPKTVASTAYLPKQVYTGDLNQDGKPDYVIAVESGGNGVQRIWCQSSWC